MVDIRGFLPVSLIEYPSKISSVVFTGGCNLRCQFCHNKDLVTGLDRTEKISEDDLLSRIDKKKEWIDAVCFTGGEPTLSANLPFLFEKIKKIRGISSDPLMIMLETNGTNPDMVSDLIARNLVDYIAMDMKAPFEEYLKLGASPEMIENIKKTVEIILPPSSPRWSSGEAGRRGGLRGGEHSENYKISSEFRITAAPEIVTMENIRQIAEQIKGAQKAVLQQFRSNITLDEAWQKKIPYEENVLKEMAEILREFAGEVIV